MDFFKILIRKFMILLVGTLPLTALGLILYGGRGAILGFLLSVAGILAYAALLERLTLRALLATPKIPNGLQRSFEVVSEGLEGSVPRLFVFPDPFPNALVIRALGGAGAVLVSQGLIAILREYELRAILRLCLVRSKGPHLIFKSFCSTLAMFLIRVSPPAWVGLLTPEQVSTQTKKLELSPLSSMGLLLVYPVIRFLTHSSEASICSLDAIREGSSLSSAMHKIALSVQVWGGSAESQGAHSLYFTDPRSGETRFPYL